MRNEVYVEVGRALSIDMNPHSPSCSMNTGRVYEAVPEPSAKCNNPFRK